MVIYSLAQVGGTANSHLGIKSGNGVTCSVSEIEDLLGVNFYKTFLPKTEREQNANQKC